MLRRQVFIFLIAFVSVAMAETDSSGDWQYEVKRDDTVWDICKNYVAGNQCWRKLVKYNNIKTPKYLPPGTVLNIPKAWLKPSVAQALVISVRGDVIVSRAGEDGQKPVIKGDKLDQMDTVTAKNGSAMIEFADQSRLLLKPNSAVRLQGLRYYQRGGIAETQIRLLKGRVRANVEKLKGLGSRFDIATPAAVAAVRGTEFRVGFSPADGDNKAIMTTELLEGSVKVANDQGEQTLAAGEAVRAVEGEAVAAPVALLPRPRLDLTKEQEVRLPHRVVWYEVKGADYYRVTLSRDGILLWEVTTQIPELEVDVADDGEYELIISAVDAQGFEGKGRRLRISSRK